MSYAGLGSGERHAGLQLRCAASAPRSSASAEYFKLRSGLVAIVRLNLTDHLVRAEEGVPRHVLAVAARRWLASETFGERADVVGTCAAADTEVADAGGEGLAAEIEDFRARRHERIETIGKGHAVAAAGIGERHERGLSLGGAVRHRQSRYVALHRGPDLLQQRHHGARAAMTIQTDYIGARRLQVLAGLRRSEPIARHLLTVHRKGDDRRHFGVAPDGPQRELRLAHPAKRLG